MGTKAKTWVRVSPKAEAKDTRDERLSPPRESTSLKVLYITLTRAAPRPKARENQKAVERTQSYDQPSTPHQHIHKSLQSTQAVKAHLQHQPRLHHQYDVTFATKLVIIKTIARNFKRFAAPQHISLNYSKHHGRISSMIIWKM